MAYGFPEGVGNHLKTAIFDEGQHARIADHRHGGDEPVSLQLKVVDNDRACAAPPCFMSKDPLAERPSGDDRAVQGVQAGIFLRLRAPVPGTIDIIRKGHPPSSHDDIHLSIRFSGTC